MKDRKKIEDFLRKMGEELVIPEKLEPEQVYQTLRSHEQNRQKRRRMRKRRLYPALVSAACFCLMAGILFRSHLLSSLPADEGLAPSESDAPQTAEEQEQLPAEPSEDAQELLALSADSYEEIYACLSSRWQRYEEQLREVSGSSREQKLSAAPESSQEEMLSETTGIGQGYAESSAVRENSREYEAASARSWNQTDGTAFTEGVEDLAAADSAADGQEQQASKMAFGRTNAQTEQVDEADRVKNDGRYLYQVVRKQPEEDGAGQEIRTGIQILDTEGGLRETAFLDDFESVEEFYVWEDLLIAIENQYYDYEVYPSVSRKGAAMKDVAVCGGSGGERGYHEISIYGIGDRSRPRKLKTFTLQGTCESSRISDGYFYGISRFSAGPGEGEQDYDAYIPSLDGKRMEAGQIYCPEDADGTDYLVLVSIDLSNPDSLADSRAVLAGAGTCYVSADNIYAAWYESVYEHKPAAAGRVQDKTKLLRFSYGKGHFYAQAQGEVPGNVDNCFSMDEYGGNLRIAVTVQEYEAKEIRDDRTGERLGYDYGTAKETSAVYILDPSLTVKGRIEGLAEGEIIRSVRFLGETGYVVTFRRTDPLFAIDLSDPEHPKVLGERKVSGFSEYLHPYGDGLLLGIGMEADEETGQEQGMKLSMFDISDPADLKEVSRLRLEDYDLSDALWDHRAVLIDTGENIIGFEAEGWRKNERVQDYVLFSWQDGGFVQDLKIDARLEDKGYWTVRGTFIGDTFYLLFENGKAQAYDRETGELLEEV